MSSRSISYEQIWNKMQKDPWLVSARFIYDAVIPDKPVDSTEAVVEETRPANTAHYESDWS